MSNHVRGTFDVNMGSLPAYDTAADAGMARMSIDKRFHGELDATSTGEMLSAGNPQSGSAGYVAIERVRGTLAGRSGSFALQHSGTMQDGHAELVVRVVPASGTDALEGLTGTMDIVIADGQHSYEFAYELPDQA
ncbi:MAG: DUF3224 domain-containing protein [Rhodanobacteraceae bacterium]